MNTDPKTDPPPKNAATLTFDVVPDRAVVLVDDAYIGCASDFTGKAMPVNPGDHRIKIELHGYETFETEINLIAGQSYEIRTRLARSSDKSGIVILPVLDRLIDNEPKKRSEAMPTPAQSLRGMKVALRRDLEWLMNTRRVIDEPPESCTELRRSVYYYGLPDISSMSILSTIDQNRLLKTIESAITMFEPRLTRVRVSLRPVTGAGRMLHFVIEGLLRVDPFPEQIVFDSVLELSSGAYQIQGEAGAR